MLEVDTEDKALLGMPDGYITAAWPAVATIKMPDAEMRTRMLIGWVALIGIVVAFGYLAASEGGRA